MHQAPTLLVILLGLSGFLSVYLAAWAQLRSRVPSAREFSYLLWAVAFYTLGYAIEISRSDLIGILEAVRVEYVGLAFIPALLMLFVLRFVGVPTPRWVASLLLIVPVITLAIVFTVEHQNLYYIDPRVVDGPFFPVLTFERGAWYYVHYAYLETVTLAALILLVANAYRSDWKHKRQAIAVAAGGAVPMISGFAYFFGMVPGKLDPGPFALSVSALVFAFALFKLGLFELVPVAREMALDSIRDSILVVDKQGRLQDLNKAAWRLPGATGLGIGNPLPSDNPLTDHLRPLLDNAKESVEFSAADPESGIHYYNATAYKILTKLSQLDGIAIVISDVTETVGLMSQLRHQANTDELTGILNRRHLMKLGTQAVDVSRRTGSPLGVILIDLDEFKMVNDKYGHAAGDEVLRNVAQCFRKGLRNIDILGRYGGEEFAVFLPDADIDTTVQVAERLKRQLAERTIQLGHERIVVTASFGVFSISTGDGTTIDDLLKAADLGLYRAKGRGRDQISLPGSGATSDENS
ncbi:MAG: diguanylate cyclase [Chloroflexi bacterium]|nr:diguanylate cyclase [Chloroflexota bacterium]